MVIFIITTINTQIYSFILFDVCFKLYDVILIKKILMHNMIFKYRRHCALYLCRLFVIPLNIHLFLIQLFSTMISRKYRVYPLSCWLLHWSQTHRFYNLY